MSKKELEPIGRRLDPVQTGDTVYYYPEGKSFPVPMPAQVTTDNGDGTYRIESPKGFRGVLRHDHMYRESQ